MFRIGVATAERVGIDAFVVAGRGRNSPKHVSLKAVAAL